MPPFEHTVEIEAPVDHVFAFGADPENWQRTTPSLTHAEITRETEDRFHMDATYRLLGKSVDGEMAYTVLEPNAHTVTTFDSPGMTGELHYRYSETDAGTKVVQSADYELGDSLLERVLEPVAKRFNERRFRNSLETSRGLIEARPHPVHANT